MIRRWTQNLSLKIMAFLGAMSLWMYVGLEGFLVVRMELPIRYENPPEGYRLSPEAPARVTVTFHGRKKAMQKLEGAALEAVVDFSVPSSEKEVWTLIPTVPGLPEDIAVEAPVLNFRMIPRKPQAES